MSGRIFEFVEPDYHLTDGHVTRRYTEEYLRDILYPAYRERIAEKLGRKIAESFSFERFLEEWIAVNWAWEVKDE